MNNTLDINSLADTISDETAYPASNGYRDPGSPAWIFRSDREELDETQAWLKAEGAKFEAWLEDKHPELVGPLREQTLVENFIANQETLRFCNWLVDFHKRRPSNNDHWRKLVAPLADKLDDPTIGPIATTILKTLRDVLPTGPGPILGTTFVNPDGSRFQTASTAFGSGKAAYRKRHKLDDEFVSEDRVQYEHERGSRLVVGMRRTSDQTPSHYYDPNPSWEDTEKREGYMPTNCIRLIKLDKTCPVMPAGSHRLTVREFEQALIAGADIFDGQEDLDAFDFELEYLPDARVLTIDTGFGKEQRDAMALTHEEEALVEVLRSLAAATDHPIYTEAVEIIMAANPQQSTLAAHFRGKGGLMNEWGLLLINRVEFLDKSNEEPLMPYLIDSLTETHADPLDVHNKTEILARCQQLGYGGEPTAIEALWGYEPDYMEKSNGCPWDHLKWK